jgi:hypothetical protein
MVSLSRQLFYCRDQKFDGGICVFDKHIPVQMSIETPSTFTMQVIRSVERDAENTDDYVRISRDGQYFTLYYFSKRDGVKHTVSLTGGDTYKYFKNLLTLLAHDDEPFSHVQFNFPATPSVMYKTSNLPYVTDIVLDQFDSMLSNWPLKV